MTRVLIVEDEGIVAFDISEELQKLGYEVVDNAASGEDAIRLAEELKPDLIFMDVNLATSMDGIQAASVIQKSQNIPIIFLTAHAEESTLQRAKQVRPYGYIIKPFEKEELRVAAELAIARVEREQEGVKQEAESEDMVFDTRSIDPNLDVNSIEYRIEILRRIPFFRKLTDTEIQKLCMASTLKEIDAGQSLIENGENAKGGFVIISGRFSTVKSTEAGKELTIELLSASDLTGILIGLDDQVSNFSVRAQVDSRVLWILTEPLRQLMKERPELYSDLLNVSNERVRRFGELALSLAHSRVEERIVRTLLALAPRFGKGTSQEGQVRLFLTRKELADLTGTTPETAIRATKAMEREGLLDLTYAGIIKILSVEKFRSTIQ